MSGIRDFHDSCLFVSRSLKLLDPLNPLNPLKRKMRIPAAAMIANTHHGKLFVGDSSPPGVSGAVSGVVIVVPSAPSAVVLPLASVPPNESDAIGKAIGVDFTKKRRRLGEIKKILGNVKK